MLFAHKDFLQQNSEWEGELFGKPDLIDRNREAGADADNSRKGTHRDLGPPGSFYEYNDVRVNRLSLSLLRVFREPLPRVLEREVMRPIDASDTWRWEGYRNATVDVEGTPMISVPVKAAARHSVARFFTVTFLANLMPQRKQFAGQ